MYREKFSPSEWNEIREEVFFERFVGDYSSYINPKGPEEFKPQTEEEKQFFKEAYEEYRHEVTYDVSDEEIFKKISISMAQKGYIMGLCPSCNKIFIFQNSLISRGDKNAQLDKHNLCF